MIQNIQNNAEPILSDMPIGVFDSGYGGLTVAKEIIAKLPHENIIYFGDSHRCPYGIRELSQVKEFVYEICEWMISLGVKLIVIACNSATAAGLSYAQKSFDIPIIGVIEPGARACVQSTRNRRVGVIGTSATIDSGLYTKAIRMLDAGITVFSVATPKFVEIAEQGLQLADGLFEDLTSSASKVYVRSAFQEIAQDYLEPLRRCEIDTLVLGCTHFPLLNALIGSTMGSKVSLISSANEVAIDVSETLSRQNLLRSFGAPTYEFYTSGEDLHEFSKFGEAILGSPITVAKSKKFE